MIISIGFDTKEIGCKFAFFYSFQRDITLNAFDVFVIVQDLGIGCLNFVVGAYHLLTFVDFLFGAAIFDFQWPHKNSFHFVADFPKISRKNSEIPEKSIFRKRFPRKIKNSENYSEFQVKKQRKFFFFNPFSFKETPLFVLPQGFRKILRKISRKISEVPEKIIFRKKYSENQKYWSKPLAFGEKISYFLSEKSFFKSTMFLQNLFSVFGVIFSILPSLSIPPHFLSQN